LKYLVYLSLILFLGVIGFLSSCDSSNPEGEKPVDVIFDFTGIWESLENSQVSFAIGIIENEESDRIILCDATEFGLGCLSGTLINDTIVLDNSEYPKLKILPAEDNIEIKPIGNEAINVSGIFAKGDWPEGRCGLFNKNDGIIGIEENCIIGEWYTKITDPFGGESELVYKSYLPDGNGIWNFTERGKVITFKWKFRSSGESELLVESDYSDPAMPDQQEFAFICTEQGLALGSGGSWIRKNILCFIE